MFQGDGCHVSESKTKLKAECEQLQRQLDSLRRKCEMFEDVGIRTQQAFAMPTDAMLDAVRPIIGYLMGGTMCRTYGEMRKHTNSCGCSFDGWPAFALSAPPDEHVPKAAVAEIIWTVMAHAAPKPTT